MKNILIALVLLPFTSFGQHFEVSEMGGYSKEVQNANTFNWSGFNNRVQVNYYPIKQISIGLFYEINSWSPSSNYCIGVAPAFHLKHFYFGVDASTLSIKKYAVPETAFTHGYTETYTSSINIGAYMGASQKIIKHLFVNEQIGIRHFTAKPSDNYTYGTSSINALYFYALAGLSYKF